jgi:hypothetical protein
MMQIWRKLRAIMTQIWRKPRAIMTQIWRKPGAIMTAYVLLFAGAALVHPGMKFPPTAAWVSAVSVGVALAAFLAWQVTRGSATARALTVVYTILLIIAAIGSPDLRSGGLVSLGLLALYLVQIALLVSTPIYDRTRQDSADLPPVEAPLWPIPPWWMAAVALAAGVAITLLFLSSMDWQSVACAVTPGSTAPAHCAALAEGYPVHFLSAIPSANSAYPVINKVAAAEDVAVWIVLSFAACYLIWLPSRRPAEAGAASVAAPV